MARRRTDRSGSGGTLDLFMDTAAGVVADPAAGRRLVREVAERERYRLMCVRHGVARAVEGLLVPHGLYGYPNLVRWPGPYPDGFHWRDADGMAMLFPGYWIVEAEGDAVRVAVAPKAGREDHPSLAAARDVIAVAYPCEVAPGHAGGWHWY